MESSHERPCRKYEKARGNEKGLEMSEPIRNTSPFSNTIAMALIKSPYLLVLGYIWSSCEGRPSSSLFNDGRLANVPNRFSFSFKMHEYKLATSNPGSSKHTFRPEELAGYVQRLASHHHDLLSVQQLFGDRAGQTTEKVSLAIDDYLKLRSDMTRTQDITQPVF